MKKIFLTMLAAAALVSCTKSEINPINEGVEIALRSDVINASGVVSRAPFEGAVSTANVLEARVAASAAQNFGTLIANGVMKFNGSAAANYEQPVDAGNSRFPNSTDPVHLYGVYPATGWTISNAVAEYTFTGKEDVMATGKISTTQQDVINATYKTLSFKHLLTRLEVKLSAAAPTVVPMLGDITAIKLIGSDANSTTPVNNKVSANYASDLALTFSSAASATSLNFYGLSLGADGKKTYTNTVLSAYELTDVPTLVAYSLVAPVTATSAATKEYFLEITTANVTGVKRVAVDLLKTDGDFFEGSTAGRSFTVSINFKITGEIAPLAAVEEWNEQGEWKGEVVVSN